MRVRPRYMGSAEIAGFIYSEDVMKQTAILVDGGFYRYRAYAIYGEKSPKERADELEHYCKQHIKDRHEERELYRIFYYDCMPSSKSVYHPMLDRTVDLKRSAIYEWMTEFSASLKAKRKFALRFGTLSEDRLEYNLKQSALRKLYRGSLKWDELTEPDFELHIEQKGVDMKIGIDIASLAYKKQVNQIILISGDSDFVPAAKLARREGIDFILDPMRCHIKDDLFEHIDGIQTRVPSPKPDSATSVSTPK